jgi:hypothetical protein
MTNIFQIILGSSIVTTIATSIVTYIFHKRTERINAEIKREFEMRSQIQTTYFEWKKQTSELLGQVYIYLNRTSKAFEKKYSKLDKYDPYFEDEIIYTSNKRIRDLIIENGHHIPPELLEEASNLVEHYDAWLVKYHNLREVNNDTMTIQIYVGPDGFRFPDKAEEKFKESYVKLFNMITNYNSQTICK